MAAIQRRVAIGVVVSLMLAGLSACATGPTRTPTGGDGYVYFYAYEPGSRGEGVYDRIATAYEAETGRKVTIATDDSYMTYGLRLSTELESARPPTIFQSHRGYATVPWVHMADLSGSWLTAHLVNPSLTLTAGAAVTAVPYDVSASGMVYNDAIMRRYFALPDKAVSISSTDQIRDGDTFKAVVEDMTAKKDALGIEGVLSSTVPEAGLPVRLLSIALAYEFAARGVTPTWNDPGTIAFTHADAVKNLVDLYMHNSPTPPGPFVAWPSTAEQLDDGTADFLAGRTAMIDHGVGEPGGTVKAEDIRLLPLYLGIDGKTSRSLEVGTDNYLSINAQVDAASQRASLDFLTWLFGSPTGMGFVADGLGFTAPFDTFAAQTDDPYFREVLRWLSRTELAPVSCAPLDAMPGGPPWDWQKEMARDFRAYAEGTLDWAAITTRVVDAWNTPRRDWAS